MFHSNSRRTATHVAAFSCALIAGCGGGDSSPTVAHVDVAAAWRNLITADATWTAAGTAADGRQYTLRLQSTPAGTGVYPVSGQSGRATVQRVSLSIDGAEVESGTPTLFSDAGGHLLGVQYSDGSCDSVPQLAGPLPTAAAVLSSGDIATSYDFASCAPGQSHRGNTSYSWFIDVDNSVTLFCLRSREVDVAAGTTLATEENCFETNSDGSLGGRARFAISVPGASSLVARNF